MPIATGTGLAIAALVGGGASITASKMAANSANRAQRTQFIADEEAMRFEREREEEAKRQWEAQQKFQADQWAAQEEERMYRRRLEDEREVRRGPYRQASQEALGRLGDLMRGNDVWRSPSNAGRRPSLGDLGR